MTTLKKVTDLEQGELLGTKSQGIVRVDVEQLPIGTVVTSRPEGYYYDPKRRIVGDRSRKVRQSPEMIDGKIAGIWESVKERDYIEAKCDNCGIEGACFPNVPVDEAAGEILGLSPDDEPGGGYTLCTDCAGQIGVW